MSAISANERALIGNRTFSNSLSGGGSYPNSSIYLPHLGEAHLLRQVLWSYDRVKFSHEKRTP